MTFGARKFASTDGIDHPDGGALDLTFAEKVSVDGRDYAPSTPIKLTDPAKKFETPKSVHIKAPKKHFVATKKSNTCYEIHNNETKKVSEPLKEGKAMTTVLDDGHLAIVPIRNT